MEIENHIINLLEAGIKLAKKNWEEEGSNPISSPPLWCFWDWELLRLRRFISNRKPAFEGLWWALEETPDVFISVDGHDDEDIELGDDKAM